MSTNNNGLAKDVLIPFRSTVVGVSKAKGFTAEGKRYGFYMTQEAAQALIAELQKNLNSPKGVKLDIHVGKKVNGQTGHQFDSSFAFCKAVADGTTAIAGAPKTFAASTPKYKTAG